MSEQSHAADVIGKPAGQGASTAKKYIPLAVEIAVGLAVLGIVIQLVSASLYQFVVFLHVLSVFAFLMAHGVSAILIFVLEKHTDKEQVKALMSLRQLASPAISISSLVIFVTGIIAGFMGNWWHMGWIGVALILFIVISLAMGFLGRGYFDRIAVALGIVREKGKDGTTPSTPEAAELPQLLQGAQGRLITVIGVGGLVVILWLMLYKPF